MPVNLKLKQAYAEFQKQMREIGKQQRKVFADFIRGLEEEKLRSLRKKLNE